MEKACFFDVPFGDLTFDIREAYRLMGYGEAVPAPYVQEVIDGVLTELETLVSPRCGYVPAGGAVVGSSCVKLDGCELHPGAIITSAMKDADFYALFTATIGEGFDAYMRGLKAADDMLRVFVADALGSVLAEAAVACLMGHIKEAAAREGLSVSNNYSPGYCDWKLVEQRELFGFLPQGQTGIRLTDSCLMLPVKSVSGIVAIGKNVKKRPYGCAICKMKNCIRNKKKQTT